VERAHRLVLVREAVGEAVDRLPLRRVRVGVDRDERRRARGDDVRTAGTWTRRPTAAGGKQRRAEDG
jgi:hypothetical protein